METLKGELRQMLTEVAYLPEGFDEKAHFYEDLGMPSMKAMELLLALEERFGVSVPDEQFTEAVSLQLLAKSTDLDLQAKCARDSKTWFRENWATGSDKDTLLFVYHNHYNKRLNKCFIQVEYHRSTGFERSWSNHVTPDLCTAFEELKRL